MQPILWLVSTVCQAIDTHRADAFNHPDYRMVDRITARMFLPCYRLHAAGDSLDDISRFLWKSGQAGAGMRHQGLRERGLRGRRRLHVVIASAMIAACVVSTASAQRRPSPGGRRGSSPRLIGDSSGNDRLAIVISPRRRSRTYSRGVKKVSPGRIGSSRSIVSSASLTSPGLRWPGGGMEHPTEACVTSRYGVEHCSA